MSKCKWISVAKKLPDAGVAVLGYWPSPKGVWPECVEEYAVTKRDKQGNWFNAESEEPYNDSITHWMPLPHPPGE